MSKSTRNWRRYLTKDERLQMAELERKMKNFRTFVAIYSARRTVIKNRATKRASYWNNRS